jgi:hypothetical protein
MRLPLVPDRCCHHTPQGEVLAGRLRHGSGVHVCADGARYQGGWRLDQRHGRGAFTSAGGFSYEGEFRHDKAHGCVCARA